jgi:hypothetical protein
MTLEQARASAKALYLKYNVGGGTTVDPAWEHSELTERVKQPLTEVLIGYAGRTSRVTKLLTQLDAITPASWEAGRLSTLEYAEYIRTATGPDINDYGGPFQDDYDDAAPIVNDVGGFLHVPGTGIAEDLAENGIMAVGSQWTCTGYVGKPADAKWIADGGNLLRIDYSAGGWFQFPDEARQQKPDIEFHPTGEQSLFSGDGAAVTVTFIGNPDNLPGEWIRYDKVCIGANAVYASDPYLEDGEVRYEHYWTSTISQDCFPIPRDVVKPPYRPQGRPLTDLIRNGCEGPDPIGLSLNKDYNLVYRPPGAWSYLRFKFEDFKPGDTIPNPVEASLSLTADYPGSSVPDFLPQGPIADKVFGNGCVQIGLDAGGLYIDLGTKGTGLPKLHLRALKALGKKPIVPGGEPR